MRLALVALVAAAALWKLARVFRVEPLGPAIALVRESDLTDGYYVDWLAEWNTRPQYLTAAEWSN